MGRLEDRVAIVTGGGTGIGAAIAERFVREGARVAISGRRAHLLAEVAGRIGADGRVLTVPGDSATPAGVAELFRRTLAAFGTVDILVNNAAIVGPVGFIWELEDVTGWEETLRVNLTGPWLCSREAARIMIPKRYGKIINIGSIAGKRPLARRTPYVTTKMGLVGLTRTLALELGPYNINVNLISPGLVDTPRVDELSEKYGVSVQELKEGSAALAALRRISQPEDVAALAAFLASDESRNITGIDITVDAGVWYS